jgi:ABC-type dipeptide/oligopeptide/nickel transport system permease subunit
MTNLGPTPPINTDAGLPGGEDPRNAENLRLSGATEPDHVENAIELKEVEGLSLGRIVRRRFFRHRAAMISLVVLVLVFLLAFSSVGITFGPVVIPGWWQYSWTDIPPVENGSAPTLSLVPQFLGGAGITFGSHPFGQDSLGHDMFAQVMRGTQISLMIVVVVGLVATTIGTAVGSIAGYFGGRIDAILMRVTDLVIIVPLILLAALVGRALTGSGPVVLALLLGVLSWTSLARLVRGEVLALREREFVEAAKVAGASDSRIIFRHILPNAVGVIIVSATLTMSATILLETALSYLQLGVQPPDVSLGRLISDYQSAFNTRPWLFWYPGAMIVIIALSVNFIGDGLRDAFDPRQRRGLTRKARSQANAESPA